MYNTWAEATEPSSVMIALQALVPIEQTPWASLITGGEFGGATRTLLTVTLNAPPAHATSTWPVYVPGPAGSDPFTVTLTVDVPDGPTLPPGETVSHPVWGATEYVVPQAEPLNTSNDPLPPGSIASEGALGDSTGTHSVGLGVSGAVRVLVGVAGGVAVFVRVAVGEGVNVGVPGPGVGTGVLVRAAVPVAVAVAVALPPPVEAAVAPGVGVSPGRGVLVEAGAPAAEVATLV